MPTAARLSRMHRTRLGLLAAFVLVLAACSGAGTATPSGGSVSPSPSSPPSAPPSVAPSGPIDPSGGWLLVGGTAGGRPIPMVPGADITFEVDGSTVSGRSACNQYFGEFVVENGVVRLGGLGGTEMGCDEPVMASELAYMQALAQVTAARMDGEQLVLLGEGVELRFERIDPPPTAELVGTTWLLDGLVSGDAVASTIGEPATLELDADGTFLATTGCRTLTGRYTTSGTVVQVTEMTADGDCAGGPADQDAHVIEVLEGGFRADITEQTLTLTGDGGRGLVYRVAEVM